MVDEPATQHGCRHGADVGSRQEKTVGKGFCLRYGRGQPVLVHIGIDAACNAPDENEHRCQHDLRASQHKEGINAKNDERKGLYRGNGPADNDAAGEITANDIGQAVDHEQEAHETAIELGNTVQVIGKVTENAENRPIHKDDRQNSLICSLLGRHEK